MKLLRFQRYMRGGKIIDVIAYAAFFVFFISGSIVSVLRFHQYEVFYYDFGIFDQAIWKASRFMPPVVDHFVIGGKWIFADHFSPSIFLLTPLYWLTDRSEVLLIAQAGIVACAGIILYAIGKKVVEDRFFSLAVLFSFYLFVGIQNAVISDFHEVTISTLPLALVFYFFLHKRFVLYAVSLLVVLGAKESTFLLGIGIGVVLFLLRKKDWKVSIATIVLSLVWGLVSIKLIIPYFSQGIYQYSAPLPHNPTLLITSFFDDPTKTRTLFFSFFSFSFLPLFSPQFFPLILQDFFIRFYPNWPTRWDLGLHYSAQVGVLMSLASLWAVRMLQLKSSYARVLPVVSAVMILNSIVLFSLILRGPFALVYNPAFLTHARDFAFLDQMMTKIPEDASVMTQNNLAVRFTHQNVWLLRVDYEIYRPDFIMLDVREGQSPNNFFGSPNPVDTLEALRKDTNYTIFYQTAEQFIFQRRPAPLQ